MQALARPLKWPSKLPLDKDLIVRLLFDARSGAKIFDRSGRGNHATLVGGTWKAGPRGSCVLLDAVDDYVEIPATSTLFSTNKGTIILFLLHTQSQTSGRGLFVLNANRPLMYLSSNRLQLTFSGASGFPVSNSYTNHWDVIGFGEWHMAAFSWDGVAGTWGLYNDGAELESGSGVTLPALGSGVHNIGMYSGGNLLNGEIREARIYRRKLTAAEIKRIYESEIPLVRF